MKKILLILFTILIITGCNLFTPQDSSVTVILNRGRAITPEDFTNFSLTVSGSGMSTIKEETSSNVIEVTVPVGSNRQFKIAGTLKNGIIISGSKTRDVSGGNLTITINLSEYDVSAIPTNDIQYGFFGLEDSLYTLLGERSGFDVGEDNTLKVTPGEGAIYYQWLSGDSNIVVETDMTTEFRLLDFIVEPGFHTLTFRVYYMDRVEEETVAFEIFDSSIVKFPPVSDIIASTKAFSVNVLDSVSYEAGSQIIIDIDINEAETTLCVLYKADMDLLASVNFNYFVEIFAIVPGSNPVFQHRMNLNSPTELINNPVKILVRDLTPADSYNSDYTDLVILGEHPSYIGDSKISLFDISNPTSPQELAYNDTNISPMDPQTGGALSTSSPKDLEIHSSGSFMMQTSADVFMGLPISDNSEFQYAAELLTPGNSVIDDGSGYYYSAKEYGISKSNGITSTIINSTLRNEAIDMVYDGGYLYILGSDIGPSTDKGLTVVDTDGNEIFYIEVTNDSAPVTAQYKSIKAIKGFLVLADHTGMIKVFDVRDKTIPPFLIDTASVSSGMSNDVEIGSQYLYVSQTILNEIILIRHDFGIY